MPNTVTRFQQLGAFVADWNGVTDTALRKFSQAGGRYLVVLLDQLGYPEGHDQTVDRNRANIDGIIQAAAHYSIAVGGWFNGWAGGIQGTTADQDVVRVASIMHEHKLFGLVCLDLETTYQ